MQATTTRPAAQIRPVTRDDIEFLCEFLEEGFSSSGISARSWAAIFGYNWRPQDSTLGFVATVDGEIVGFIATICARRQAGSKSGVVCNCAGWYVRPDHRNVSLALLMAAHRDRTLSYTNFNPNSTTSQMLRRMGFSPLSRRNFILPALINPETLLKSSPFVSFDPDIVYGLLDDQQRRIFDHHSAYDCSQAVVVDGNDYAYLVAKRRIWRPNNLEGRLPMAMGIPYTVLLHCSRPEVLTRHLERIKLAFVTRHKTLGLVADEHLFRKPPRGFSIRTRALYRSDVFEPRDLDLLYSELVLLPL